MADAVNAVNIILDGKPIAVPRGTNLIEAAKQARVEVPHYCYHPKLPIAGNCRMCLLEMGTPKMGPDRKPELGPDGKPIIMMAPKLVIGCNTQVSEGMVVNTSTPKVRAAREGVMEFLLINHPLDCPICDQAGECRLQEFAVDYGRAESRFLDDKEHKPKRVPLNTKITLDNERCILCTRCVRFMKDVAKQDCLGIVERGGHSELAAYPGHEPKTNYDLNIVDICPVGALTSNDFRFRQRVWFMKETRSICSGCATGCNTVISARDNVVLRQQPRDNEPVNQCWMCDEGRLNYKFINDPARLVTASARRASGTASEAVRWADAINLAAEGLKELHHAGQGIAVIGSGRATTEELYLLRRVATEGLHAGLSDIVTRTGKADDFLVSADRNPNSRGAQLTEFAPAPGTQLPAIAKAIADGKVQGLLVLGENITKCGISEELLKKLQFLVVIDTLPNAVTELAHVVIPGMTFAEKQGTFINAKNRIQRLNVAVRLEGELRPEWQTLAALLAALGGGAHANFDEVFAEMTRRVPALHDLTYAGIGDLGVELKLSEQPVEKA